MLDKLTIIAGFAALVSPIYLMAMRSTPHRGVLKLLEKLCLGIILCYCCQMLLQPFGVPVAQGPIASLSAGYLGLPGAALSTFFTLWP